MKAFVPFHRWIGSRITITGVAAALVLTGCAAPRSDEALLEAQTLKASTLALMDKATDPYAAHAQEVGDQNSRLETAYTRETTRPGNEKTVAMWDLLLHADPARPASGIYPRFVTQWQSKGALKPVYIADKKTTVGLAFDRIIRLESVKRQP